MARRAVECFRSQTYENKKLLIWETGGRRTFGYQWNLPDNEHVTEDIPDFTIGELRNRANGWMYASDADIMIHWDDDDWSHPNRIAEQVALLQASGKQVVGYRDMLFWRDGKEFLAQYSKEDAGIEQLPGKAWLYSNNDPRYCLGTSLCYWRSTWEHRPFADISRGEDKAWLREVDSLGVSSMLVRNADSDGVSNVYHDQCKPRMIASIHSGNHVVYEPERHQHNWKRVPEWDQHCRETMAL